MDKSKNTAPNNNGATQEQQPQPQYQQPQYQQPVYQQPPQQPPYQQPVYQQPIYQQPPQVGIVANPCPRCGSEMTEKFSAWQIVVSILLFPIGLISLAAGKKKKCSRCGHTI